MHAGSLGQAVRWHDSIINEPAAQRKGVGGHIIQIETYAHIANVRFGGFSNLTAKCALLLLEVRNILLNVHNHGNYAGNGQAGQDEIAVAA